MAGEVMRKERLGELTSFVSLVRRMIDEEWTVTGTFGDDGIAQALKDAEDIGTVLTEVERLRARVESDKEATWKLVHAYNERGEQLKAALAVVRAVADGMVMDVVNSQAGPDGPVVADALVLPLGAAQRKEQARALLASTDDERSGGDGG